MNHARGVGAKSVFEFVENELLSSCVCVWRGVSSTLSVSVEGRGEACNGSE